MLDENKILAYQKEKKDLHKILVISDFSSFKEVDYLPYYVAAAGYGYQSSDIIFKDYRELIHAVKLSDLKYSLEYEAIISLNVPKEEFDSSFLGELARDEDLFHVYPYFLYLNPHGVLMDNPFETGYSFDLNGNIIVTPKILETALDRITSSKESADFDFIGTDLFINNRVNVINDKVITEKYHFKDRNKKIEKISDLIKKANAIDKIYCDFIEKEEDYLSKNAAALALITRQGKEMDHMLLDRIIRPTYSYYYFASSDKEKAKKFAASLREKNNDISDMWLYYIDNNGHKYSQASEHIYGEKKYINNLCPAISVEERVNLYNLFSESANFRENI